jgi:hypothetical protein
MVLTAYVVLSPVTGLFCHRRQRIKFCLSPVGPTQLRELDASVGASGPHDFAVRCNISRPRAVDRSQVFRLALQSRRTQNAAASTATHPAFVTIAIRPSCGVGWRELVEMICPTGEAKYFCKRDSTPLSTYRPTGKSAGCAVATNQTRLGQELINASALADLRFGAHCALKSDIGHAFARAVGFAERIMRL